jgi:integrase
MKHGTVYQRHTVHCPRSESGDLLPHRCRGTWSYHVDAGRDGTGRRRQLTKGGFATRADARAALHEILVAGTPRNLEAHRITVEAYLGQWLDGKRGLRPSTRKSYQEHINLYLVPHLGRVRLRDLTATHIDSMISTIGSDQTRRLSPTTIRRIHATLRAALNTAVRRQLLSVNPATQVELPPRRRTTVAVWTPTQLRDFLIAIQDDRLYPLYHLVALTGLRRGEAIGLRWSDLDLERHVLTVNQQVVQIDRVKHIGPPKTNAGQRVVPLDPGTAALLEARRAAQQVERDRWGAGWTETGHVFTSEDGSLLSPDYVTRHFRRLVKAAGLPELRLHGLRHTNASLGLAAGVAMKVVSERLGHSAIAVTADLYTHVVPVVAQQAANAIADLVALPPRCVGEE